MYAGIYGYVYIYDVCYYYLGFPFLITDVLESPFLTNIGLISHEGEFDLTTFLYDMKYTCEFKPKRSRVWWKAQGFL